MKNLFACLSLMLVLFVGCTDDDTFEEMVVLEKNEISFGSNTDLTKTVELESNTDWDFSFANTEDAKWVTISPKEGSGDATITITLLPNEGETREALLIVKTTLEEDTLRITQSDIPLDIIDFEEIKMGADGYVYGTATGEMTDSGNSIYAYTNTGVTLHTYVNPTYGSWSGVLYSSKNEMKTPGFGNQYSVYYKDPTTGKGGANGSNNFAVFSASGDIPTIEFTKGELKVINSVYITNSTYAVLSMTNGDQYAKKFTDGDWFKLTITGFDAKGEEKTSVDFYLADYRDGKKEMATEWQLVSLKDLGDVNKVEFTLESSDKGQWGMNTPAYFCVDNIAIQQ